MLKILDQIYVIIGAGLIGGALGFIAHNLVVGIVVTIGINLIMIPLLDGIKYDSK